MYVKIAYRMYDHHGYRFMDPEKYYGVTVNTTIERNPSIPSLDEKILKINSRSGGGMWLYNPHFEVGPDHIVVDGTATFNLTEKPPEGVHAPVARIAQQWILKINLYSDEEKEYEKVMKEIEAKEKKSR